MAEALFGEHYIPLGDKGVVAFVSVNLREAKERLDTIEAILEVLKVQYKRTAQEITLEAREVVFRTFAATGQGVVGFTCIAAFCDEVSRWRDADTGANPATEVLASLRPTQATMPNSRMFLSSSPLGTLDAHAAAFERGSNEFQQVAFAPTWVAHPALTEAYTHTLEPDEEKWSREYGAIPFEGSDGSLFSPGLLDRATRDLQELPYRKLSTYLAWMDPGMRRNAWTFGLATNIGPIQRPGFPPDGNGKRAIVLVREWIGSVSKPLDPFVVFAEMAKICKAYEVATVTTDGFQFDALAPIASRAGITLHLNSLTAAKKLQRYESLQARLADGQVELPPHRQVRADLLNVRRRLTPNGFSIELVETPDGRHADYAPVVAGLLDFSIAAPPQMARVPTLQEQAEELERLACEEIERAQHPERLW